MARMIIRVVVLAAVFLAGLRGAFACTAPPPPSNFELIKQTNAIVLGRVVSFDARQAGLINPDGAATFTAGPAESIRLQIEETLKGDFPDQFLTVPGNTGEFL